MSSVRIGHSLGPTHIHVGLLLHMNGQTIRRPGGIGLISTAGRADLGELQGQGCLTCRVNVQLFLLQLSGVHMPCFQSVTHETETENAFLKWTNLKTSLVWLSCEVMWSRV